MACPQESSRASGPPRASIRCGPVARMAMRTTPRAPMAFAINAALRFPGASHTYEAPAAPGFSGSPRDLVLRRPARMWRRRMPHVSAAATRSRLTTTTSSRLGNRMQLRGVDTNLIIALRALLLHQNVTRAAKDVGLSQSSMSHALSRLRVHFDDALLVPVGRGLVLTDRGKGLVGPVAEAVA